MDTIITILAIVGGLIIVGAIGIAVLAKVIYRSTGGDWSKLL